MYVCRMIDSCIGAVHTTRIRQPASASQPTKQLYTRQGITGTGTVDRRPRSMASGHLLNDLSLSSLSSSPSSLPLHLPRALSVSSYPSLSNISNYQLTLGKLPLTSDPDISLSSALRLSLYLLFNILLGLSNLTSSSFPIPLISPIPSPGNPST